MRNRSRPADRLHVLFRAISPPESAGSTLSQRDHFAARLVSVEGPNDKVITFLELSSFDRSLGIPDGPPGIAGVDYLHGKTMNKLIASECRATADALREANRPLIRVVLPQTSEHSIAQLLYMLEVEG